MARMGFLFKSVFLASLATTFCHLSATTQLLGPLEVSQVNYDKPINVMGPATLTSVKAHELSISGPLRARDLQVLGSLTVLGPLDAEKLVADEAQITGSVIGNHMEFRSLFLTGSLKVSNLVVHGSCRVIGSADVRVGKIDYLEVIAEQVELEDVEVGKVVFLKQSANKQPPRLILKGNTRIQRGLVFESGDGQIRIEGSNVQIQGTVEGATPFVIRSELAK